MQTIKDIKKSKVEVPEGWWIGLSAVCRSCGREVIFEKKDSGKVHIINQKKSSNRVEMDAYVKCSTKYCQGYVSAVKVFTYVPPEEPLVETKELTIEKLPEPILPVETTPMPEPTTTTVGEDMKTAVGWWRKFPKIFWKR